MRSELFYLGNNSGPNDLIVDFGDDTLPMVNVIKGVRDMSHFILFFPAKPRSSILRYFRAWG